MVPDPVAAPMWSSTLLNIKLGCLLNLSFYKCLDDYWLPWKRQAPQLRTLSNHCSFTRLRMLRGMPHSSEAATWHQTQLSIVANIAMAMQCYLHTNNRNIMTGFNAILLTLNCLQLRCNIYNMKCETLICNENENWQSIYKFCPRASSSSIGTKISNVLWLCTKTLATRVDAGQVPKVHLQVELVAQGMGWVMVLVGGPGPGGPAVDLHVEHRSRKRVLRKMHFRSWLKDIIINKATLAMSRSRNSIWVEIQTGGVPHGGTFEGLMVPGPVATVRSPHAERGTLLPAGHLAAPLLPHLPAQGPREVVTPGGQGGWCLYLAHQQEESYDWHQRHHSEIIQGHC